MNFELSSSTQKEIRSANHGAEKTGKIFVLEDEPDILRLIEHQLQLAGFETAGFTASMGMLEQAHTEAAALFLLDIMLPRESGLEVCRRIRRNHRLGMTPVVFLTARAKRLIAS